MVKDDDNIIPGFHAVEFMRQARERLSREMEGKSPEEIRRMLDETLAKWNLPKEQPDPTPTSH